MPVPILYESQNILKKGAKRDRHLFLFVLRVVGVLIKFLLRGFTKVRYNITITSLGESVLWRNFFQGADRKRRDRYEFL